MTFDQGSYDEPGQTYDAIGLTYDVGVYVAPVAPTPTDPLLPSPAQILNFSDVAVPTALIREIGIEDGRIYPRTMKGYPDPPFLICLDYQEITQEIVKATDAGPNYWDVERDFDNSGLYAHDVGSVVIHSTTAFNYTLVNHHIHVPTIDWHPQYMDDFRHAHPERHEIIRVVDGQTRGTLAAGSPIPSMPGDTTDKGTSSLCIASDHAHPRESIIDIVTNAIPQGMVMLINRQKKTDFFWLNDIVAQAPQPFPFPYAPSGVTIPLSMLGLPSESSLIFGGRRGAIAPDVDPQITGVNQ